MADHRSRTRTVIVALSLLVLLPAAPSAGSQDPSVAVLQDDVVADLDVFTDWLVEGGHFGRGYVGEVGWPADPRWEPVARSWYAAADRAWLWTSAWAAGPWWGDYPLAVFDGAGQPTAQAEVVLDQAARKRSVSVAGAEFGTPGPTQAWSPRFSSTRPGVVGIDYVYPDAGHLASLASAGITTIRLPVRWERLQRVLGGPLDADESERLVATFDAAAAAGLDVVLDLHNYGAYWAGAPWGDGYRKPIGGGYVTIDHFADVWSRLASTLAGHPALVGYGLMNEPVGLPGGAATWEQASQAAIDAIRAVDATTRVFVSGYFYGATWAFPVHHPAGPWIDDPAGRTWYEAHHYFDCDHSGTYPDDIDTVAACVTED